MKCKKRYQCLMADHLDFCRCHKIRQLQIEYIYQAIPVAVLLGGVGLLIQFLTHYAGVEVWSTMVIVYAVCSFVSLFMMYCDIVLVNAGHDVSRETLSRETFEK